MSALGPDAAVRQDGGWGRSPVAGLGVALSSGAIAVAALLSAAPLGAAPSSPAWTMAAASSDVTDLDEVRERLSRRSALHRFLTREVDQLALEIEDLVLRRDETAEALSDAREATRHLERQLDRVVPRLVARAAALRERRDRAGRALAELAAMSRQVQLDATLRSRMLAVSPVLLARLRGAEASVTALEDARERAVTRHRELETRGPLLRAERDRLERRREQKKRQYHAMLARLERLDVELVGLARAERRLAEVALHDDWARAARAEPQADEPALAIQASAQNGPADIALDGLAPQGRPPPPVRPAVREGGLAQVVAAMPGGADPFGKPSLLDRTRFDVLPPLAKPLQVAVKGDLADELPAGSHDAISLAAYRAPSPDRAPLDHGRRLARLPGPSRAPLLPAPDRAVEGFGATPGWHDDQGITILAEPGQAVAAPEDGRVVFADRFKAYGWLLIIEHDSEYHTLLWGFSRLDVAAGDHVATGQIVGVVGAEEAEPPKLHVELRRQGRPVNPLPWLAASSSKVRG